VVLAQAVAAAVRYECSKDPAAVRLQEIIHTEGVAVALSRTCGIEPDSELARMVLACCASYVPARDQAAQRSSPKKNPQKVNL